MNTAMPRRLKGVACPYCNGVRFRSRGRYRPLHNVKIVYASCVKCDAHLTFKVTLIKSSPPVG
jgi:RNase P subunit RPR2